VALAQRFAEEGIEGLLRDKTRPPGIPPVPQVVERTGSVRNLVCGAGLAITL